MSPLRRRLARLAALLVAVTLATSYAFAAEVTSTLIIAPGQLTAKMPHKRVSLSGWAPFQGRWRRGVARVPVVVTDLRGSGAGWTLGLRGRVVDAAGRPVGRAKATIARVGVRCSGSCTRPRRVTDLPVALTSSATTRTITARRGSGMGRVAVGVAVEVFVPRVRYGPLFLAAEVSRVVGP